VADRPETAATAPQSRRRSPVPPPLIERPWRCLDPAPTSIAGIRRELAEQTGASPVDELDRVAARAPRSSIGDPGRAAV
jgi:hypothetical protein